MTAANQKSLKLLSKGSEKNPSLTPEEEEKMQNESSLILLSEEEKKKRRQKLRFAAVNLAREAMRQREREEKRLNETRLTPLLEKENEAEIRKQLCLAVLILSRDAIREREKEICSTSLSDLEEQRQKAPFNAGSEEEEKQRKKEAHLEKMLKYFFGNAEEAMRKREGDLAPFREAHKRQREFEEAGRRKPDDELLLEKMVWEREFYSFEVTRLTSLLGSKEYYWVTPLSKEEEEKKEKREKELAAKRQREAEMTSARLKEEGKRGTESFKKKIREYCLRPLTEEEERLKQSFLDEIQNPSSDLSAPNPYRGPGWILALCTEPELMENIRAQRLRNSPSLAPLPQDNNRRTVRHTPEIGQQYFEEQRLARNSTMSTSVISREQKREKLAAQGRCLTGSYLTPYCKCDDASRSQCSGFQTALQKERPPEFAPIWLAYKCQIRQSHCFDIDDHPGSSFGASVGPLAPNQDFNGNTGLLMELANRAIWEYNKKECNVFKYKVLKIEKVNFSVTGYYLYWMTVKVLNLTLGTPVETFQIHAGINTIHYFDKVIYCCQPKEEAIVGLPSCEFCFGKLPGRRCVTGGKEEALELPNYSSTVI